jgi:hypothetical protein
VAERLAKRAVGGGFAPADLARGIVDGAEEGVLAVEIERDCRRNRSVRRRNSVLRRRRPRAVRASARPAPRRDAAQQKALGRLGLPVGSWKRVMPTAFQAMPQKPPAVSKTV